MSYTTGLGAAAPPYVVTPVPMSLALPRSSGWSISHCQGTLPSGGIHRPAEAMAGAGASVGVGVVVGVGATAGVAVVLRLALGLGARVAVGAAAGIVVVPVTSETSSTTNLVSSPLPDLPWKRTDTFLPALRASGALTSAWTQVQAPDGADEQVVPTVVITPPLVVRSVACTEALHATLALPPGCTRIQ